jgi:hypothetical protein
MSLLGKLLAIFNVLAAIGFFCVAILDYSQRQAWSYAVLCADTLIKGLPLDENEVNLDGDLRHKDLNEKVQSDIFTTAGANAQPTQLAEVRRVKGIVDDYLGQKASDPDINKVRAELVEGMPANGQQLAVAPVLQTRSQRLGSQIVQLEREIALEKRAKQPRADVVTTMTKEHDDLLKKKSEIDQDIQALTNKDSAALAKLEPIIQERKLAGLLLHFASSGVEFEELMDSAASSESKALGGLQGRIDALFDEVLTGQVKTKEIIKGEGQGVAGAHKLNTDERKLAAARLLYNLIGVAPKTGYEDPAKGLQRVVAVCGLANTVNAVEAQSQVLRKLAEDIAYTIERDRSEFVTQQYRVMGKAQDLADELRKQQLYLRAQQDLVSNQTDLVNALEANIKDLKKLIQDAENTTQEKLIEQTNMEKALFEARKQLRDTQMLNQKREQQIRELEKAKAQ